MNLTIFNKGCSKPGIFCPAHRMQEYNKYPTKCSNVRQLFHYIPPKLSKLPIANFYTLPTILPRYNRLKYVSSLNLNVF